MNRRGFTLIELITVISILALLMILLIPSISELSNRSKDSLNKSKERSLIVAAERYGNQVINDYQKCVGDSIDTTNCVKTVEELKSLGLAIDKDLEGEVLFCYNPEDITVTAKYYDKDNETQKSCS